MENLTKRELFAVQLRRQKKEQLLDKKRLNLYILPTSSISLVLGTLEQQLATVIASGREPEAIVSALLQILSERAQDDDLYNERVSEALESVHVQLLSLVQ